MEDKRFIGEGDISRAESFDSLFLILREQKVIEDITQIRLELIKFILDGGVFERNVRQFLEGKKAVLVDKLLEEIPDDLKNKVIALLKKETEERLKRIEELKSK